MIDCYNVDSMSLQCQYNIVIVSGLSLLSLLLLRDILPLCCRTLCPSFLTPLCMVLLAKMVLVDFYDLSVNLTKLVILTWNYNFFLRSQHSSQLSSLRHSKKVEKETLSNSQREESIRECESKKQYSIILGHQQGCPLI